MTCALRRHLYHPYTLWKYKNSDTRRHEIILRLLRIVKIIFQYSQDATLLI